MNVLFDSTTLKRSRFQLIVGTIACVTFFGFLPVYVLVAPFNTAPLEWVVFGLWGTLGLLCLAFGIMGLFAREQLILEGNQVRSIRWLGCIRRTWAEPLDGIQEVTVYSIGPNLRGGGLGSWHAVDPHSITAASTRVLFGGVSSGSREGRRTNSFRNVCSGPTIRCS